MKYYYQAQKSKLQKYNIAKNTLYMIEFYLDFNRSIMNRILSIFIIFVAWLQPLASETIERERHKIVNAVETNRYYDHSFWDDDHGASDSAYRTELIIEYALEMDTGLIYHLMISELDEGMIWKGYGPGALTYESSQIYWTYKNFTIQSGDELQNISTNRWLLLRDGKAVPFYRITYTFDGTLTLM